MSKRIIQINSVCGVGSTGRIVTDIYHQLKVRGDICNVFYGRGAARSCEETFKIGNDFDFYKHVLGTRIFDNHAFFSSENTRLAIKKIDEFKPDIIHLHNIHGYYINVELLFEYLRIHQEIKVVWTLHDCWAFTGHCCYFENASCDKWKYECFNCPQKNSYPASYLLDNSFNNFNRKKKAFTGLDNVTIVTPSQWLADLVKNSYLGEYQIHVINNGIDLDVFTPRQSLFRYKYDLENKFLIMGAASDWSPRKGFDDFVSLANLLPNEYTIVMIGLSKDRIKNLPSNIIGIERTNNPIELAEIYSSVNVFFNPTYEDNYPTVNLEAIACGTPVITYNTGGSPESVSSGHGFVVAKSDVAAVVEIIKNIEKQPLVMPSLPASFDKNNFVDMMISIYNSN
ncbi:glycosyltransferase [Aeromonas allosaccharophila]|uniref:glycosyltransferase n=1 Tax=Aeromonas allosaccharophila TaxID=656 RepID=UPI003003C23C